ncbi:family 20 glycosylhydrolase [Streptomyces sp. RLB3-17]|nr:beta-N-acetylhexosaminidase [Streptomyces sp. WAC00263]NMI58517.1 family 20 glycosylhydrolase [Streptomyces sp. RLA2-12]QDN57849.1 family 20 glycosylhydrolase [Streptomyces sp. S1D4-20]QDN67946.1 family 20 glycosylhydrolase [Streptomyces sp. S1D4-14]QDN78228.1 family 20 glycosylhydrolase [Streptomyces sp. S1A1-7]QDN87930.1 family 20 glycosylhydrolase [Streptomyces sp. RLB3-6]QDO08765.1 family 20 glycosylhydrolase [Streptomyces sp. S1D4-23]QDO40294.1 family 20 glycosylhydrolase [Streptomyc
MRGIVSPGLRKSGLHPSAIDLQGPSKGAHVRQHRTPRLLGTLLLVAAAGVSVAGAAHSESGRTATPLGQVVPAPASVHAGGSPYRITDGTRIRVEDSPQARRVGAYLADVLRPSTGYRLPVTTHGTGGIRLRIAAGSTGAEGYRLDSGRSGVTITAAAPAGLFHGVQTLRQLLPAAVEKNSVQAGPWLVAGGTIKDSPRYGYRGAMLDVSRHFFGVAQVKRYIDELALYKVNKLHLHLSDDQGWRIAIDSWPRLATYGGSTQVGGGHGGYYTKADYKEIVRYAASRYLEVVPEIDMPGHTNAALASYAQLNCNGTAPPLYTGTDVGFSSLCVAKPVTYDFVDDVVRELAALTPGKYLHIGGDEAHSTSHADYVTFMDKVQPVVAKYGKTVIGWHQLTGAHPVKGAIAQYWGLDDTSATEKAQVAAAARNGTGLVLSPADRVYLDMKYTADTPLGQDWAGLVEVKRSYDWDPGAYLPGAPASAIRGVEAPLWSETIVTGADIDYMTFPRLPGAAELGWSPASTHDWDTYKVRLAAQGPRWEALGIGYYRSPQVPWPTA